MTEVVAACGLAQGMDFPASVAPIILRGVILVGIDSVCCSMNERLVAWQRLAKDLQFETLTRFTTTIGLDQARDTAGDLLAGNVRGCFVVDVNY